MANGPQELLHGPAAIDHVLSPAPLSLLLPSILPHAVYSANGGRFNESLIFRFTADFPMIPAHSFENNNHIKGS